MNSKGICWLSLESLIMYPLSWLICNDTQHASPCTSAKRLFISLHCIVTHSLLLGILMQKAARVVKLDLYYGSIGAMVLGSRFQWSVSDGTKVISCLMSLKH